MCASGPGGARTLAIYSTGTETAGRAPRAKRSYASLLLTGSLAVAVAVGACTASTASDSAPAPPPSATGAAGRLPVATRPPPQAAATSAAAVATQAAWVGPIIPPAPGAVPTNVRVADDTIHQYRRYLLFDSIKPIYRPLFVLAAEARLADDELILGVIVSGAARAYPLSILRLHEIVNDEVGGVPVLVSWCSICNTGLVHDRRIDGEEVVFGNAGGLFRSAMTMYDHKTRSIWSQPWGRGILGSMRNVELRLLPSWISSWAAWETEYPHSLVLVNDLENANREADAYAPNLVIGIQLAEARSAYYVSDIIQARVINTALAGQPVVLWAEEIDYRVYLRRIDETTLTFRVDRDAVVDVETGSMWDMRRGLARSGPLAGQALLQIPSSTAYDWAWVEFYPDAEYHSAYPPSASP